MPMQIVEKYRMLYRNYYMDQTLGFLSLKQKDSYTIHPFDEQIKRFEGYNIIVDVGSLSHPNIFACNNVLSNKQGKYDGIILISEQVFELPLIYQKVVMAHEWIEVMYCFEYNKRISESKRICGKQNIDSIIYLLSFLDDDAQCIWQDSKDDWLSLYKALRYLLVSKNSIIEMLENIYDIDHSDFFQVKDLNKTMTIIRELIKTFSDKWSVDPALVQSRIRELLLQKG